MIKILKNLINIFEIEEKKIFFYFKLKELYMKVFVSSSRAKEKYIQKKFKKNVGYKIDFSKSPQTFSEKVQFRKLYDDNPLYAICADKYKVREYVKEKVGEEYLIPLLLVTDKLTEDNWNKLPIQFVIKANHDSGTVKIIRDKNKVNSKKIIKELNNKLKFDFGILSLEKYYSNIPRKIIVEEILENIGEKDLKDYKFFCFDGKMKYCQLIKNRSTEETIDFYDREWKKQDFIGLVEYTNFKEKTSKTLEKKPKNYELMIKIVEKLAENFDFVRIDLYNIDGKIYFGEMTFCPASGLGTFIPEKWDYKFGSYWNQKRLK